ncbi:hypothetical protein V8G54_036921 [Vigna mungo]|uniref:Uncharacterized protein n=1 Tax=Vigna mungo TaxID=3915 RepID=A0AAQ3RG20_VIGMU
MSWNREVVESWSFCLSGCHFCAHNHTHISPNRKPQQKENAYNRTHQSKTNVIGANIIVRSIIIHFQYLIIILPQHRIQHNIQLQKQPLIIKQSLKSYVRMCSTLGLARVEKKSKLR